MSENQADIYKAGTLAASLTRFTDRVVFAYCDEYLTGSGAAVASTLPLTTEPRITQPGAVPPFFAGLLPEGRRLTSLRRTIKASADDEFALLLAVGSDPIGDVQVVAKGTVPTEQSAVEVARDFGSIRFRDLLADVGIIDPVSIAGVQDKVSARMLSLPVSRAHERYILKLTPPEFPHLVENEAFFIELARAAKMPTAPARIVHDSEGRAGLLVTRFDRPKANQVGPRLAVEDACQVLDLWPADKYNVSMETCARALIALCDARPVAAREIFRQTAFAWLTGNGDLHAKNLSVLKTPEGEWRISPAYDLPSTVPYGDETFALSMGEKLVGFSRRRLLAFASTIGLPERAALSVLDSLLDATEFLSERIAAGALPFDNRVTAKVARQLAIRRRDLSARR